MQEPKSVHSSQNIDQSTKTNNLVTPMQGSAMVFGANILPVFEQLGLLEEVRKISLPCLGMDIYNAKIEKVAFVF